MPTNLPSSFASAAAGQNANSRGGRSDGRGHGGGDWSRRDGRSVNGTMTFRRASTTPLGGASQAAPPPVDTPTSPMPASDFATGSSSYDLSAARYSRDDLLDMFSASKPRVDLNRLFISGWDPSHINGNSGRGWGKSNENHIPQEPGACWDQTGDTTPMGLQGLSVEEKEAFATDINSPLKPPTQNKEGHQSNVNGRKGSVSQGSGNAFGVSSPSAGTRPGTRRRETHDANPFGAGGLGSPTTQGRFARDDQPSWLPKKTNDGDADESADPKPPFGNLMRTNTTGSTGLGSMWPSSNPTTPGAGGFGSFSMASSAIGDKRVGSGASAAPGGGSRLAHLIPRDGADSTGSKTAESQNAASQSSWRSRPRTDTDPFGEGELSGSAVLGGSQDDGIGARRAGTLGTPVKGSADDFGMSELHMDENDKNENSPSATNPYRSPHADRYEREGDAGDKADGAGQSEHASNFGTFPRAFGGAAFDAGDRSQTSSVGAKGYPMGGLSGWPAPSPGGGAFGSSLFGNMGDLQSPGLGNLGNVFSPGAGSIGRGSKLGSLFPAAMQAQMQSHDQDGQSADNNAEARQNNPLGAIGRGAFGMPPRETESPMRTNRGVFEELFPSSDANRAFPDGQQPSGGAGSQSFTPVGGGMPFGGAQPSGEPPSAQVRQMVMPDRMRWVYLDPQGQVQGPFTGLEMNDWYKANFFTPDLRVKKVEDTEFEPLGQLIRRIGNSREPFLVPQIGIPHGPPSQGGPFNNNNNNATPTTATNNNAAGVVPPLSGVFPSFGRTLTADEQNNLERRKQEEQYLAAQQREFMMRQQGMPKFPVPGGPNLQHHSSAQSLQSQPSFGSMNGPIGMPQHQASMGSMQSGFNEAGARQGAGHGEGYRPEELNNFNSTERELLASIDDSEQPQQSGLSDLPSSKDLNEDAEGFKGRLQEFEDLRAQHEASKAAASGKTEQASKQAHGADDGSLSLTEQVQITQAAAAAQPMEPGLPMPFPPPSSATPLPAPTAQRVRSNLPEQYSRSQSATPEVVQPPPMAPWAKEQAQEKTKGPSLKEIQEAEARKAAQAEEAANALRKAAMAQEDALARERAAAAAAAANAAALPASSTWGHGSPSTSTTPWIKPGSVKPSTSGLSTSSSSSKKTLAEIQHEEEARKAKARQVSAQTGAPAPSTKSYANLAGKPSYASPSPALASPAAGAGAGTVAPPPGWSTVGAGGKVKTPGAAGGTNSRSASISSVAKAAPVAAVAKPSPKPASVGVQSRPDAGNAAVEEFNKWVGRELSKGITGVTDIAAFQSDLASFPLESGIIADAVYSHSTTMDGRRFAEEYVRRKKLADKGVVEKQTAADRSASGGWSEVAKKGGNPAVSREPESSAMSSVGGFKVVPSRKKGKK